MSEHTTTADLLDRLQTERQKWNTLLQRLNDEQLNQSGAVGHWSIKDLIAHITWSERETVGILRARAFVGSELWTLSQDARNAAIYESNRDRPLAEIQAEAASVFEQLIAALQPVSDADINSAQWLAQPPFPPFPLPPWQVIARNTYMHYQTHTPDLQAWIERVAA